MADNKFGNGRRVGHLMFSPTKYFQPAGSKKWYRYDSSTVPSIKSGELLTDMFTQKPGPYKNRTSVEGKPTYADIINTQAGDSDYYNKLLDHYDRILPSYWHLMRGKYDRRSAENLGTSRPSTVPVELLARREENEKYVSPMYATLPTADGNVIAHPERAIPSKQAINNTRLALFGSNNNIHKFPWRFLGLPDPSIDYVGGIEPSTYGAALLDTTSKAYHGNMLAHEVDHISSFGHTGFPAHPMDSQRMRRYKGGAGLGIMPPAGTPMLVGFTSRYSMTPHYRQVDGHPNVMADSVSDRALEDAYSDWKVTSKLPTELQNKYETNLSPYTTREIELTQALASYNRNRNNLINNIKANRQAYIDAGFSPEELASVLKQPMFYADSLDEEARFINDIETFRNNPQLAELLGSEGRRAVGYWDNINKSIDTVNKKVPDLNNKPEGKDSLDVINDYVESSDVNRRLKDLRDMIIRFRILGNNRTTPRQQYSNATGTAIG